ncbi:MAG: hypothetical protein ACNS60_17115 [Candidatus Cyclobacteriaceae bacterium M2_1C_046]
MIKRFFAGITYLAAIILFILILTSALSCASGYHPIQPKSVRYNEGKTNTDNIGFEYQYNMLQIRGNKKYAKKEEKKGINVVALKITNYSSKELTYPEDFEIMLKERPVHLLKPEEVKKELKQNVPIYLLYSLLWVTYSSCENNDCNVVPIPVGAGISLGNMLVAGSANKNFEEEIKEYDLNNKKIQPGETVYGLAGFYSMGYQPLYLKVKNNNE